MIHQYKLGGYNIVVDVYSGSVHAVDELAYDAIALIDGRAQTEASGNVEAANVGRYVDLGVDFVSCGALTHSAPILDVSLKNLHPVDVSEFFDGE